jgi:uncharacterized protein YjlB
VVVKEGDALLIPAGTVHSYVNLRVVRIKIEGERVGGGVWGWLDFSSLGTPDTRKLYV